MTDIKVGDTVRLKHYYDGWEAGTEAVVTKVPPLDPWDDSPLISVDGKWHSPLISVDGKWHSSYASRLEVVPQPTGKVPGVFNVGDKVVFKQTEKPTFDGKYDGVFTIKSKDRNTLFELEEIGYLRRDMPGANWSHLRFEHAPEKPPFKPGDVVECLYGNHDEKTIIGYYENGHEQYPNLPKSFASGPIVVYTDYNDGYPTYDHAESVKLIKRAEDAPASVPVEPVKTLADYDTADLLAEIAKRIDNN